MHPLLTIPCSIEFGMIGGGEFPSTFANKVEIGFNAQFLPRERDNKGGGGNVMKEIEDFVSSVAKTGPWFAENPPKVEWLVHLDCGETPIDHAFVQAFVAIATEADIEPVIEGCHFHTDMGWPKHAGIHIVNFAAGNLRKAHQDENLSLPTIISIPSR